MLCLFVNDQQWKMQRKDIPALYSCISSQRGTKRKQCVILYTVFHKK